MRDKKSGVWLSDFKNRDHEALMSVWRVGQLLRQLSNRFFLRWGATEAQFNVLMAVKYVGHAMSQQELAGRLVSDKSAVSTLLTRMEANGLIKRRSSAEDRRLWQIELTAQGSELIGKVEPEYMELVHKVMGDFGAGEMKTLMKMMNKAESAIDGFELE